MVEIVRQRVQGRFACGVGWEVGMRGGRLAWGRCRAGAAA